MEERFAAGANYLTNTQQTYVTPVTGYQNPGGGQAVYITSASLSTVGSTGNGNFVADSLVIKMAFCFGTTTCTSSNTITLTATYGNNDSTPTYTCVAGSGVSSSVQNCSGTGSATAQTVTWTGVHVPTITVSDSFTMSANASSSFGSTTDTLTSFSNTFGNAEFTPEPSTFVMLGSALLGLGGLQYRRRKSKGKDA